MEENLQENMDEQVEQIVRETDDDMVEIAPAPEEEETKPAASEKKPFQLSKMSYYALLAIFSAVFLLCAVYLGHYFFETGSAQKDYDVLASIRDAATAGSQIQRPTGPTAPTGATLPTDPTTPTEPVMLPELAPIYELNNDLVGWFDMPYLNAQYPVVQKKDDQDYYLYRDFYGQDNISGCLYVDADCDVFQPSDSVVIYGHAMKTGAMFGGLSKYQDKSYWEQHQTFTFDTLYERHTYQIFCVFKTTGTQYDTDGSRLGYPYHVKTNFANEEAFNKFISDIKGDAFVSNNGSGGYRGYCFYDTGITPQYGDKLLCLSTCEYSYNNGRLVVMAVRID